VSIICNRKTTAFYSCDWTMPLKRNRAGPGICGRGKRLVCVKNARFWANFGKIIENEKSVFYIFMANLQFWRILTMPKRFCGRNRAKRLGRGLVGNVFYLADESKYGWIMVIAGLFLACKHIKNGKIVSRGTQKIENEKSVFYNFDGFSWF